MSHVVSVSVIVKSLDALEEACKACGLILRRNQTHWKWFSKWVDDYHGSNAAYKHGISPKDYGKCLHAISVPGNKQAYEIGVIQNPKGDGFVLVYDFYQGGYGLEALAGKECQELTQQYTKYATLEELKNMGITEYQQTQDAEGNIELTVEVPEY